MSKYLKYKTAAYRIHDFIDTYPYFQLHDLFIHQKIKWEGEGKLRGKSYNIFHR